MEFRVFLPVLRPNAGEDIAIDLPQQLLTAYSDSLVELKRVMVNAYSGAETEECRTDTYIAGANAFGLKFRGEEKLELKVRQPCTSFIPGIEVFQKTKLGKKTKIDDEKFPRKVLKALHELGNTDDATNAPLIDNSVPAELHARCVPVSKSRCKAFIELPCGAGTVQRVCQEYCDLSVVAPDDPLLPAQSAAAPLPQASLVERWVSVAYEGDLESFFTSALAATAATAHAAEQTADAAAHHRLWRALHLAGQITRHIREQANLSSSNTAATASANAPVTPEQLVLQQQRVDAIHGLAEFCPVVAGYPTWVRFLHGCRHLHRAKAAGTGSGAAEAAAGVGVLHAELLGVEEAFFDWLRRTHPHIQPNASGSGSGSA